MLNDEQIKEQQRPRDVIKNQGVGSSEIAAVAGLSPWSAPIDVWQRKVGLVEDNISNHHTERGKFLEDGLARWLSKRAGYDVHKVPTLLHSTLPFVFASPDGAAYSRDDGLGIASVELKSPAFRTAGDWEDPITHPDGIPFYYVPQVTWECACLDVGRCDVAALIDGDLRVYSVPYNRKLFEVLARKAEQFMEYVVKQEPPPIDGSDSASRWLLKRFPQHDDRPLLTSDNAIEADIHNLREIKTKMELIEQEKKYLENKIKEYIGEAPGVQGPWGKITWKKTKDREGYDNKSLIEHIKQNNPDLLKGFFRTTPGPRVFRPYFGKEEV